MSKTTELLNFNKYNIFGDDNSSLCVFRSNELLQMLPMTDSKYGNLFFKYIICCIGKEINEKLDANEVVLHPNDSLVYFNIDVSPFFSELQSHYKGYHVNEQVFKAIDSELVQKAMNFYSDEHQNIIKKSFFISDLILDKATYQASIAVNADALQLFVPRLADLREAHLLSITQTIKFKNIYSERLYIYLNGIIQMYHLSLSGSNYSANINMLKSVLGVSKGCTNYENKRFSERVLKVAQAEILELSDISFDFTLDRVGTKTIKVVKFTNIQRKKTSWNSVFFDTSSPIVTYNDDICHPQNKPILTEPSETVSDLEKDIFIRACQEAGFTNLQIIDLFDKFGGKISAFGKARRAYALYVSKISTPIGKYEFFISY